MYLLFTHNKHSYNSNLIYIPVIMTDISLRGHFWPLRGTGRFSANKVGVSGFGH